MFSAMAWWRTRTWIRRLEEQNSLSRYASMPLQMLSHRDGVRRRTNEGFIPGEVTYFPEFVRLPPVPGLGEHRIGSWALLAWLVIPFSLG